MFRQHHTRTRGGRYRPDAANNGTRHAHTAGYRSGPQFLPAKDFGKSRSFYRALGFQTLLDGDVAIFGIGASAFILQNHWEKGWTGNFMMQLMVDDLDAWWAHIHALDLPGKFGVPPPSPPAVQPWGLRVAYVVDPSGVLWHVAQRRTANPAD